MATNGDHAGSRLHDHAEVSADVEWVSGGREAVGEVSAGERGGASSVRTMPLTSYRQAEIRAGAGTSSDAHQQGLGLSSAGIPPSTTPARNSNMSGAGDDVGQEVLPLLQRPRVPLERIVHRQETGGMNTSPSGHTRGALGGNNYDSDAEMILSPAGPAQLADIDMRVRSHMSRGPNAQRLAPPAHSIVTSTSSPAAHLESPRLTISSPASGRSVRYPPSPSASSLASSCSSATTASFDAPTAAAVAVANPSTSASRPAAPAGRRASAPAIAWVRGGGDYSRVVALILQVGSNLGEITKRLNKTTAYDNLVAPALMDHPAFETFRQAGGRLTGHQCSTKYDALEKKAKETQARQFLSSGQRPDTHPHGWPEEMYLALEDNIKRQESSATEEQESQDGRHNEVSNLATSGRAAAGPKRGRAAPQSLLGESPTHAIVESLLEMRKDDMKRKADESAAKGQDLELSMKKEENRAKEAEAAGKLEQLKEENRAKAEQLKEQNRAKEAMMQLDMQQKLFSLLSAKSKKRKRRRGGEEKINGGESISSSDGDTE